MCVESADESSKVAKGCECTSGGFTIRKGSDFYESDLILENVAKMEKALEERFRRRGKPITKEFALNLLTKRLKYEVENVPQVIPILLDVPEELHERMRPVEIKQLPAPTKSAGGIELPRERTVAENATEALVVQVTSEEPVLKPGMRVRVNPYAGRDTQLSCLMDSSDGLMAYQAETRIIRREDVYSLYPGSEEWGAPECDE